MLVEHFHFEKILESRKFFSFTCSKWLLPRQTPLEEHRPMLGWRQARHLFVENKFFFIEFVFFTQRDDPHCNEKLNGSLKIEGREPEIFEECVLFTL